MQANLQRKRLATDEMVIAAEKRGLSLALLQEPYTGKDGRMKDYRGARVFQSARTGGGPVKAAIAVFDADLDVIQCPEFTTANIVVVKVRTAAWEILVVSFYFEPKPNPIEPYLEQLERIMTKTNRRVLLGGDSNAKSFWWGNTQEDDRGAAMSGALEEMKLHILNKGNRPTFYTIRGGREFKSSVDITVCTEDLLAPVEDWVVDEGITSSDHNAILFNLKFKKAQGIQIKRTTRVYNSKKANWTSFHEKMEELLQASNTNKLKIDKINNKAELENEINIYTQNITEACNQSIPKLKQKQKINLPWWTEELASLKKEVTTMKRRIRCAAPVRKSSVVAAYLKQKEKYESEVSKAQVASWKEFCERQDGEGMWQGIYRVILKTTKRHEDPPLIADGKLLSPKQSANLIAETFYPEDREGEDGAAHRKIRALADQVNEREHDEDHDPPFTMEELRSAASSFNPKKAPGADGFTADICSQAIGHNPETFLSLANACMRLSHFPNLWKSASVIILRKPGKESYSEAKSYRPIGLLPVMGKILEKLMVSRLRWHLLPKMSTSQYGFMPQKSTEDSLYDLMQHLNKKLSAKKLTTLISLDIEGAFDNAWWPAIKLRLAEERCPLNIRRLMDSYLSQRSVRVRYAGEEVIKETNKGCVQGSIGGPTLWNLLLDPLLKELKKEGVYVQAFADDVVLALDGDTAQEVQTQANAALARVQRWGVENKLRFAPHKTKALLITNKLKHDTPHLTMGGVEIAMSRELKLLGLWIDDKLTFNTHAGYICRKALNIYGQLSRAAKISWGLQPEVVRTIYFAVVEPVVMYAASVWAPATKKWCVRKQLNAVQRGFAQKLCRAYRTVSLNSALVLSGLLPLDLRIQEAAKLFEAKRGVPLPVLADREIERRTAFTDAPHPAQQTTWQFECLVDEDEVSRENTQDIRIFTDGSKIEDQVGASLSIWNKEVEIKCQKLKLPSYCTVYQAELLAICKATEHIAQSRGGTFGIYSDSRSALETLVKNNSSHPLALQARRNLTACTSQNKSVELFWLKAHVGIEGNERADQLAKDAALKSKTKPHYDRCPVSFVKRCIRMESLDEWNQRYRSEDTGKVTRVFLPDAVAAYGIVRKMGVDACITQALTGHGGLSEYLHRFKCKESPSCICDPEVEETALHVLVDCPATAIKRYNIEIEMGIKISLNTIHEIMASRGREKFLQYCKNVIAIVNKRNKT
jgi:ribonuclease HI